MKRVAASGRLRSTVLDRGLFSTARGWLLKPGGSSRVMWRVSVSGHLGTVGACIFVVRSGG